MHTVNTYQVECQNSRCKRHGQDYIPYRASQI